jgi:tRNA G37 N-methylase Trm5
MLNENFIFFNNLNDENIFINQFESPILSNFLFSIDFTSTINEDILKKIILEYDPSYIQWPIEIHTFAYIFHNKLNSLSHSNINNIVSELIRNNYILNNFSETIKQKYYDDGILFLNKFINKRIDEIISEMILYFKSWDNYALSILYLQIIIKIYQSIKNKNNKFMIDFMKLLLKNISFHPNKRFSLTHTKNEFNKIINNISKNEFKEVIDALCDTHD